MTLSSPQARTLAVRMVNLLRSEWKDGFRNRNSLDRRLTQWRAEVESLAPEDSRRLLQAVRPLLAGYATLGQGQKQESVRQAGVELARLAGLEKTRDERATRTPAAGPVTLQLSSSIQFVKGIGPQLAARLKKSLGLETVYDLVMHLPRRWEDRTQIRSVGQLRHGVFETVKGVLGTARTKQPRRGLTIVQIPLHDAGGEVLLTWFNQPYVARGLAARTSVVAYGKVEINSYGERQMTSPEVEPQGQQVSTERIVPVYPLTGNLTQKWMRKIQYTIVPTYGPLLGDPLPAALRREHDFSERGQAVVQYHWPSDHAHLNEAERRLAFEELFLLQVELARKRRTLEQEPRTCHYHLERPLAEEFRALLPFPPTGAQARVFGEVLADLGRATPMNRLLQGDVGAGKTVVAAFAAWVAIEAGYQAAIMAPTEILAEQHGQKLQDLLAPAGVRLARLSGSLKKREKKAIYAALAAHELDLVVGTHALIQEGVEFARLGMVVVDEQHKFGVMQRTTLRQKGSNPDLLVMTATPIPRTLALTLYGDLEVSRLDELPPGRQPILSESVPFSERKRIYAEIRAQIQEGRQAYIICPLVEETEKVEATAAVEEAEVLRTRVFPEFSVGLLHGRMKAAEKDAVMEAFRRGELHILISTTVIEVGVDVPNATLMLVQDANRFGLAQLHQLRGRVGRGRHASRCIFMGDAKSEESARRLRAVARLSDGFDVAEEDLQIRGPGDYYGLRQSGFPEFKVADLLKHQDLLMLARQAAERILAVDPELEQADHAQLRASLEQRAVRTADLVH